jgi:exonuclease SbcC
MIIHRLSVTGFRIIGQLISIEFPDSGRIAIIGENESGKSTILEAISSALYGLSKEDITWGKDRARVELEFSSGEHRYLITRTIGRKQLHTARLVPIVNGSKDIQHAVDNVTEIRRQIEQLTGMDEGSFTKLVYVKQKDLDALRNLTRGPREELVNKVMGIEIFDHATTRVEEERRRVESGLSERRPTFERLKARKEEHEKKAEESERLSEEIKLTRPMLEQSKAKLDEIESSLRVVDWLRDFKTKSDLLASKQRELEDIEKRAKRLEEAHVDLTRTQSLIGKFEPIIVKLQNAEQSLAQHELLEGSVHATIRSLEAQRNNVAAQLGLDQPEKLPQAKSNALALFVASLVAAAVFGMGALVFLPLAIIAVVLVPLVAGSYGRYSRLERTLTRSGQVNALNSQIEIETAKLSKLVASRPEIDPSLGIKTSQEASNELGQVRTQMQNESGHSSVDGLRSTEHSLAKEIRELAAQGSPELTTKLQEGIAELTMAVKALEQTRPQSVDEAQYSDEAYAKMKRDAESGRDGFRDLQSELIAKEALHKQLSTDLSSMEAELSGYDVLGNEVLALEKRDVLLASVRSEYAKTSKELRAKVIPQAKMIINQILPTLTGGRYSDFEITDDLKFKVYAAEAGDHREREVFSGGTQDQFLIALRLAFTQSILDSRVRADKYCLMLDECISSSDENRKQGVFEILDLMKGTFAQILVIAHEDISNLVDHYIVLRRNAGGHAEIESLSWRQAEATLDAKNSMAELRFVQN